MNICIARQINEALFALRPQYQLYQCISIHTVSDLPWLCAQFENNVWSRGAQNQYPGEVEFYQRKHNALKVRRKHTLLSSQMLLRG